MPNPNGEIVLRTLVDEQGKPYQPPMFYVPMEYFHDGLDQAKIIPAGAMLRCNDSDNKVEEIKRKMDSGTNCLFEFPDPSRLEENVRVTIKITHAEPQNLVDEDGSSLPGIFLACELDQPTFDILLAFGYVTSQQF